MSWPAPDPPAGPTGDRLGEWRCYRHPEREGGVRCQRCERPICEDCMIQASVGFQCPSCARTRPRVAASAGRSGPVVTYTLIALNAAVFLPTLTEAGAMSRGQGTLTNNFALFGPAVAAGEWWRLVTSGFLHYGLIHIGFNMVILYQLGLMLEPALGRARFAILYLSALLAGSFGALLIQPDALTAGASGAVFGLMGAAVVGLKRRGVDPMQSGLGGLLAINLVLTFVFPGISIGGHIGGLVGGALAATVLFATETDSGRRALGVAGCAALAALTFVGSVVTASNPLWPF